MMETRIARALLVTGGRGLPGLVVRVRLGGQTAS